MSWCKWTATSHWPVRIHQRPIWIFYLIDQEQISQSAERSEVKEKRMSVQFQNRRASCSSKVKIKLCQIARYCAFCGSHLQGLNIQKRYQDVGTKYEFLWNYSFSFLSGVGVGWGLCLQEHTTSPNINYYKKDRLKINDFEVSRN